MMADGLYEVLMEGVKALFLIGVPVVLAISIVGTIVAALQAATTITEPAIGYAARLAALIALLYFLFPAFSRTCTKLALLAFQ